MSAEKPLSDEFAGWSCEMYESEIVRLRARNRKLVEAIIYCADDLRTAIEENDDGK